MTSKIKTYAVVLSQFEDSVNRISNPMIDASWEWVGNDAPELLQGMADILEKLREKCKEEGNNQTNARHLRNRRERNPL